MNTILNSLFYVSGYEFGSELFLGVFSNDINEVIEEDMRKTPCGRVVATRLFLWRLTKIEFIVSESFKKISKNRLTKPN